MNDTLLGITHDANHILTFRSFMSSIFDKVCNQVIELVEGQVTQVERKGLKVKVRYWY